MHSTPQGKMLFHYDDMILWCRSLEFQLSLESNQWNEWMKKNHKLNRHGISTKINSSFFLYSTFSMHFFMLSKRKHVKYSHWQLSTIWKFIASIYKLQCQIEFIILVKWKSKWKAIQRQAQMKSLHSTWQKQKYIHSIESVYWMYQFRLKGNQNVNHTNSKQILLLKLNQHKNQQLIETL